MMRFRKPWIWVKSVNFDLSAKSSNTDFNELNKPTLKFLAHIGSEKSPVELEVPKNEFLTIFARKFEGFCRKTLTAFAWKVDNFYRKI